jgi:hypothetical protein
MPETDVKKKDPVAAAMKAAFNKPGEESRTMLDSLGDTLREEWGGKNAAETVQTGIDKAIHKKKLE